MHINEILGNIHKKINAEKIRIIGINGIDASGKTFFAASLCEYLDGFGCKTVVINLDDFLNEKKVRYKDGDTAAGYIKNAFNLEFLEREILKPLSDNGRLNKKLSLLNLSTDKYENMKEFKIDNDAIVLIEGVLLFREPVDKYLDMRIYLDISHDEMMRRVVERDVPLFGSEVEKRYRDKYIPVQEIYLKEYDPVNSSDLVIDNNDYENPFIKS